MRINLQNLNCYFKVNSEVTNMVKNKKVYFVERLICHNQKTLLDFIDN